MFEDFGFESERAAPALVRMRNCPFHPMTAKTPELVCSVNQAFLAGCLEGHGLKHLRGRSHSRAVSRILLRLAGVGDSPVPPHPYMDSWRHPELHSCCRRSSCSRTRLMPTLEPPKGGLTIAARPLPCIGPSDHTHTHTHHPDTVPFPCHRKSAPCHRWLSEIMSSFEIDEDLVRSLAHEQHPDLAGLDLCEVVGGWDNQLWRLGASWPCACHARTVPRPSCAKSTGGSLPWPRVYHFRSRPPCGSVNRPHASRGHGPSRHGFPANQPTAPQSATTARPTLWRASSRHSM